MFTSFLFYYTFSILVLFTIALKETDLIADIEAEQVLGPLGRVVFDYPSPNSLIQIIQPFSISVNVELSAIGSFNDWMLCYTIEMDEENNDDQIDNQSYLPYCMNIILKDGSLSFLPSNENETEIPLYNGLNHIRKHKVLSWFSSIKSNGKIKWGISRCEFEVYESIPKHISNNEKQYLINDSGDKEFDVPVLLLDGNLVILDNFNHSKYKVTPTVSGVIIDMSLNLNKILKVILNIMEELPSIKPIHYFHGVSFYCHNNSYKQNPNSLYNSNNNDNNEFQSSYNQLCLLVEKEIIILHSLTIQKTLSLADKNEFMKTPVFWSRISGTKRVFIFDENTFICSATSSLSSYDDDTKQLDITTIKQKQKQKKKFINYYALNFDYIGCQDKSGYSLRDVALSTACATTYGKITGSENENSFFERCVLSQGGKVANIENSTEFCYDSSVIAHSSQNQDQSSSMTPYMDYVGVHFEGDEIEHLTAISNACS